QVYYFNNFYWHLYGSYATWRNKIFAAGGGIFAVSQGNCISAYSKYVEILDVPMNLTSTIEPVLLDVFPNPSSGTFTIALPEARSEICVVDAFGREVLKSKAFGQRTEFHLDQSG